MMRGEVIICNTGPLIALSMVGCLDVLKDLYRNVLIPEAVIHEVLESGAVRMGAKEIASRAWLKRVHLDSPPDPLLAKELGPGEAAVISMAFRMDAGLVLIDERRARRIADHAYRLRVKGSAGILVAAKQKGLVTTVRPLLETMSEQGYFLSTRLIHRACREAGE